MNNILKIGLLLIIAIVVSTTPAIALQDPYPLHGYVVFVNGTSVGIGANVTFMNMGTGEIIYDDTSASGWYVDDAGNFPSGYQNGQTIAYYTVYGSYTNNTSHVIDVTVGCHPMNIILEPTLKGDLDGDNKLTYNDAAIALQIAVGSYPFKSTADMNNNGKVTSLDALIILQAAGEAITL